MDFFRILNTCSLVFFYAKYYITNLPNYKPNKFDNFIKIFFMDQLNSDDEN